MGLVVRNGHRTHGRGSQQFLNDANPFEGDECDEKVDGDQNDLEREESDTHVDNNINNTSAQAGGRRVESGDTETEYLKKHHQ